MSGRDDEALVGTVLQDSYRLTRLIGAGGMGAVYEGLQLRLNKRVAVKLMVRDLAANQEALARFRREAEVTSHLGHPHIVHVFDFGAAPSGEPYLVMEYLEGEDLDHRIRREGRISLDSTVHVIKQVASALAATHAKGVVHRDLKPANVFVMDIEGETDFIKVVDFGISKVKAATTKLTGASVVMGTPNYMSPEQARGQIEDIDHRTDQWSLACIAYEMLTGRGPFVGENAVSLLYQVIHQEPPPLALRAPGLPEGVQRVLSRALSKSMADRFGSITDFSRAFDAAANGRPEGAIKVPSAKIPQPSMAAVQSPVEEPGKLPQPTTLSHTASELVPAMSRFRAHLTNPKKQIIFVGGAVLLAAIFAYFRTGAPKVTPPPVSVASTPLTSAAIPTAAPVSPPTVSPPAPPSVPQPLAKPAGTEEATGTVDDLRAAAPDRHKVSASSNTTAAKPPKGHGRTSETAPAPIPAARPKGNLWVDPFSQDDGTANADSHRKSGDAHSTGKVQPAKPKQDQDANPTPKPKRRLIEDL